MSFLVYAVSFVMKLCNPEGGMSECLDLFLCHYAGWLLNNHFHLFTVVNTYLPGSHLHQKVPSWLFICMSRKWLLKALYFWFLALSSPLCLLPFLAVSWFPLVVVRVVYDQFPLDHLSHPLFYTVHPISCTFNEHLPAVSSFEVFLSSYRAAVLASFS